ncbi:SIMPL domain-containing protein [Rhodoferax sp.]|uniref:SIMPL domain-containing protein n=1 Tax=Rhodoferax sp. TaxID=50421 RepID=UPI001A0A4196|nr:SIMPL domain-containing protein [Rhodoferax sp.]MBE0475189.1 SIMPL domain-containing protein [Rhodoferax sp.]
MKNHLKLIAFGAFMMGASAAFAQTMAPALPTQRVSLAASATVQVPQDELTLTLSTQREGVNAPEVQSQLKAALDAALTLVKPQTQSPLMSVRTGRFGLSPRHDRNGKLVGWQGTAELVLQGNDFVRISQMAGQLQTLSVASVSFGLSTQLRQQAQAQAQSQAIAQFQKSAAEIAKSFGFDGYTLGEINVNANQIGPVRPYMMAASARAMADEAPVPMEAGLSNVSVNVSGSVQLK